MYFIYSLILYLALPLVLLRLLWLGMKTPAYLSGWGQRFGYGVPLAPAGTVIWIHAVSVGEVQAAKPLVDHLLRQHPRYSLLISTVTPTGAQTVRQLFNGTVPHRFFPYDLPGAVERFLERIDPALVLIIETEIWPNLYRHCLRRRIPVALINARLSEKSLRGYRRFRSFTGKTLRCLSLIAAQSRADAERFLSLGAAPATVQVTGNLKFDINQRPSVSEAGEVKRRFFSGRPTWIAASTHAMEEEVVLAAFTQVLRQHGDCLLILAPRHPERAQAVTELSRRQGFKTTRHSENGDYSDQTRVYILDTLGELPVFYAAADVSFVGGSLIPAGGHNILEPASLGVPIICGPHLFNFSEAAELLSKAGALDLISTPAELAGRVNRVLEDANLRHILGESGRKVIRENQGTLQRVLDAVQDLWP
jgi:3-deoxy-D-manno-octulosonic-acid transferase